MVKRKILEEMSNEELLKYVRPESRFVYEAIEIAYETLKGRGMVFSITEEQRIIQMIKDKKYTELHISDINKWDINAVDENSSNIFYSQKAVWFFSVFGGIHFGSILLAFNLFSISKKRRAWLVVLFGFFYSVILYYAYNIAQIYLVEYSILICIILTGIGASVLQFFFWDKYLANIHYKKKKILTPLFLCVVFNLLIFLGIILFSK